MQTDASSLGSHLSSSALLSLAPSPSPPLSLTPLISRAERVINDPRYWLLLLQVQSGVGGYPVQNQGVLGGSKAELGLNKGSHFRDVQTPAKCLIQGASLEEMGLTPWKSLDPGHHLTSNIPMIVPPPLPYFSAVICFLKYQGPGLYSVLWRKEGSRICQTSTECQVLARPGASQTSCHHVISPCGDNAYFTGEKTQPPITSVPCWKGPGLSLNLCSF